MGMGLAMVLHGQEIDYDHSRAGHTTKHCIVMVLF